MLRATDSGSPRSSSGEPGTRSGFRGSSAWPPRRRGPRPKPEPPRRADWKEDTGRSEVDGLGRDDRGIERRADAQLLLDLLLDLVGKVGVVLQEVAGVLLALPELVALVRVPSTGLLDHALLDTHVDEPALAAEALTPQDVELGLLEGRRDLVLDDLDAGPAADRVGALLQRLDAADVEPDRRVELQRPP